MSPWSHNNSLSAPFLHCFPVPPSKLGRLRRCGMSRIEAPVTARAGINHAVRGASKLRDGASLVLPCPARDSTRTLCPKDPRRSVTPCETKAAASTSTYLW